MKIFISFLLLGSLIVHGLSSSEWKLTEEYLSPEVQQFDCHSSSIVETDAGLFAVWKGGPGSGKSNIDIKKLVGIWASLFDGTSWSGPKEIVSGGESVCWNPVLCNHPSGEILLFYRMGYNPRRTVSFVKRSPDGGMSWSDAQMLPAGIVGPTKNKPFVTEGGALVCPSSIEVGEPEEEHKATACWMDITDDKGIYWNKVGPLELKERKFGVIEPALFLDAEGRLNMFCRDRAHRIGGVGFIWTAVSEDGGIHWSELKQTALPNPDSAIDVVDLGQGKLLLVYNHSHTDRFPLHLAISTDGGES